MLRTFETNYLREVTELSSSLWEFSPNEGEFQGNVYPVWVPCCWENLPDFMRSEEVEEYYNILKQKRRRGQRPPGVQGCQPYCNGPGGR